MLNVHNINKEELLDLLAVAMDGIDGVEVKQGVEALARFWDVEKIERARVLLDQLGIDPMTEATSG